jgi:hypothetical protein
MKPMFFDHCADRAGYTAGRTRVTRGGGTPVWVAGALAVLLLVVAGVVYRVMASGFQQIVRTPMKLPVPLSAIPLQEKGWTGADIPIETVTREYMQSNFADDYISRRYVNAAQRLLADVYVVYCSSHPSGIIGHKPQVCYPGNGWSWDETVPSQIVSRSGRRIECLIHQFHKQAPTYQQVYVLNFYVLNGQITLRERDFSGFFDRLPNIAGNPARYVAQVQISSLSEQAARVAASDLVDTILAFLPDEQGQVRAAGRAETSGPAQEATAATR